MSFQQFTVRARLATEPELTYTPTGTAICKFRIAFDAGWGEKQHTIFLDTVSFGKRAETYSQYLSKGRDVIVCGEFSENVWEKDGKKHSKLEITTSKVEFLSAKEEAPASAPTEETVVDPF